MKREKGNFIFETTEYSIFCRSNQVPDKLIYFVQGHLEKPAWFTQALLLRKVQSEGWNELTGA